MSEASIILIDDDETLLELLGEHLHSSGYQVRTANTGSGGISLASEVQPELVILDVMMPGMDGWEVCRRLRAASNVLIIMLTAKEQEIDKLRGFRLGVDDYVTKPFSFAELTARVGAVLSRTRRNVPASRVITSADLVIDLDRNRVMKGDEVIALSPTEFRMLEALVTNRNHTLPLDVLLETVWGAEYAGEVEHVKHYIWLLRKKIESDPGDPQHIITERGFGYRFE